MKQKKICKRDYCTSIPDVILGKDLSCCCKEHDNMLGKKGSYNPLPTIPIFWNCLRKKLVVLALKNKASIKERFIYVKDLILHFLAALIITFGGSSFAIIRLPRSIYHQWQYRKEIKVKNTKLKDKG